MTDTRIHILIVGPAWVGDMVMAQSLFKLLKQRQPQAQIDVVAPAWTEPLLIRMPEVRRVIPLPLGHGQLKLGKRWRIGRLLRGITYDQAIVLPRSLKSAIIPFAARAKRRTGFLGEMRWGLLNDVRKLDKQDLPRTIDRFNVLALEQHELPPAFPPLPELKADHNHGLAVLRSLGHVMPEAPVLGLCPGAEYGPAKRWPVEHFSNLAKEKINQGWEVWLFGSSQDVAITNAINKATKKRCFDLGGKTKLGEAIDVMALTTAVVSNDSGLMHVAAALNKPLAAIYGSSDPGFTPPLNAQARIIRLGLECSPCFERECPLGHTRCLHDLQPQQVMNAITELMA
ncbi:MAG: lipopolysaccharide heptosyltransferase II [Gammaproteobacteria bacterium]|nr:MAG: lipopolysaccharide heptosyltransferase II [Gammaproteobacteria bacterium]